MSFINKHILNLKAEIAEADMEIQLNKDLSRMDLPSTLVEYLSSYPESKRLNIMVNLMLYAVNILKDKSKVRGIIYLIPEFGFKC